MSSRLHWEQLREAWRARRVVWLVSGLLLFALTWATFARLDEVVLGDGRVVPSLAVQKIQSLEGGILKRLMVTDGQKVKAGEVLAELDDTRAKASFGESEQQAATLLAARARLRAELASVQIGSNSVRISKHEVSDKDAGDAVLALGQAGYLERMAQLDNQLAVATQQIEQQTQAVHEAGQAIETHSQSLKLLDQEVAMTAEAVHSGALPAAELRKLQRDRVQLSGTLDSARTEQLRAKAARAQAERERLRIAAEFRSQAQTELAEVEGKLSSGGEVRTALADQLSRTRLVSPVAGTVKNIEVRSVGGVIRPGEPIMEIVPSDDRLLIEANVQPRDIARVHNGLRTIVKFSAYDFVIYGSLPGTVTNVSSDALQDEEGRPFYRVKVAIDAQDFHGQPIIPGMQTTVDIVTGQKSVLAYLLKPLLRAQANALRER